MNILDPSIVRYLHSLTPPRDSTLQEMERIAAEKRFPIIPLRDGVALSIKR